MEQAKAGIAILDVSGHHATDGLLAAMMHQSFLLGVTYELDMHGNVTKRLFENLNTRFYHSSSLNKFVDDDLRRDLRGHDVPVSVRGASASCRVFKPAQPLHGSEPGFLHVVPSDRHVAVARRD
jgi:hypothetical protein